MATLVSVVATVVFAYSISYMADQPHQGRFYAELSLFAAAMLAIVMAADLLTLFIAWELVGLSSYLLIAFRFQEPDAPPAATKALLVTRLGDLAMLAGLLLLVQAAVSSDIGQVLTAASSGDLNSSVLLIAALLIFAGAAGKSAQWPLQGWLPDAMVAPTPVSALLHSATMVAAGVFLVARLYPLFEAASLALPVVAWVGATTAVLGGAAALAQTDLKRTLAYSTLSQMGLMLVGLGSGSLIAGLALLIAHALYKATLFLAAGAVEQEVGSREYRDMGGLARRMPVTFEAFVISAAALAGLPVSMALPSKDAALAAALGQNWALFALMLVVAILTALYASRALALVFLGPASALAQRAREASAGLGLPSVTLAVLLVLGLLLNSALLNRPLERLMDAVMPHLLLATMLALLAALVGIILGLGARYLWPSAVTWLPLRSLAPLFAGEFGLGWAYGRTSALTLSLGSFASAIDRRGFDPVGARGAAVVRELVAAASIIDRSVFDALSSLVAQRTLGLVRASIQLDRRGLEGAVQRGGAALLALGQSVRGLQTGGVGNYLLGLFIWGLVVIALALVALV